MPRRARILMPGVPLHLIQRGNNRSVCFFSEEDYLFYIELLAEQANKNGCEVHAWCLMSNHVHLLISPQEQSGASLLMKGVGQRYVQYVNRTYGRSGTLWEGRFRSSLVQSDRYVLACYRYIEMNPVRAKMVAHPGEYRWSSYRNNAQSDFSYFITPHAQYLSLGGANISTTDAYRELFRNELETGLVNQIRAATNGNYALGGSRFAAEIEAMIGRRAQRGRPGRPSKPSIF
ncbi:transposase [Pseudomonas migulae]|uniref:Transposase n=1 Tax=Pseudomonas migulae TaxID=78543 RepID=A0ABY8MXF3_9PSED|nr:transposase [Pseudomonas migulae]WGK92057.1 transposase [Pseudomonas migulae]